MQKLKRLRPSPAMVVALISLSVAVSGVAWAAATIGPGDIKRNAVRKKHIKKNQVRAKHIKKKQVKTKHLKGSAVKTAKIANDAVTGTKADESTFGTVPSASFADTANPLGYAHVNEDGSVTPSLSFRVASGNVSHPDPGVYCISGLPFTPHAVHGTVDAEDGPGVVQATVRPPGFFFCPSSAQVELLTLTVGAMPEFRDFDGGFYVTLH